MVKKEQGQLSTAQAILERVASEREAIFGRKHKATQVSITGLTSVMMKLREFEPAGDLYKEIFDNLMETFKREHISTLAAATNLARSYLSQHKYEIAEDVYRQAYDMATKHYHKDHPRVLFIVSKISKLEQNQGKLEATASYRRGTSPSKSNGARPTTCPDTDSR